MRVLRADPQMAVLAVLLVPGPLPVAVVVAVVLWLLRGKEAL